MTQSKIKILVVEDDVSLSFLLNDNLKEEGFDVHCCADGNEGLNEFLKNDFHLCILDVMLPKQDGFRLAENIRKKNPAVPIIFLTARSLKEDIYKGFEAGADDYITKPFTIRELLLRIRAILKRSARSFEPTDTSFNIGNYTFNYNSRELAYAGKTKKLSTKENELLRLFCENPNTVINRSRLLMEVWGNDDYFVSKSLDVYITRLRKLLNSETSISIQNYHSVGYKLIIQQPL